MLATQVHPIILQKTGRDAHIIRYIPRRRRRQPECQSGEERIPIDEEHDRRHGHAVAPDVKDLLRQGADVVVRP